MILRDTSFQKLHCALLIVMFWLATTATAVVGQPTQAGAAPFARAQSYRRPIKVKIVVVTAYETGADEGDTPGELQLWVEREKLNRRYALPSAERDVRANEDGVFAVVTGVGTARAAASIMALGLDSRFDFSHAYWLVAGIAGGDPEDTTLGSAVWAEWVIDADLAYEIDAREAPADWPTGYVPWGKTRPYQSPALNRGEAFHLNPALREWAYQQTRSLQLPDTARMAAYRTRFRDHLRAQQPPSVIKGDDLSGSTFWHGRLMNRWANDWVRYWSAGQGNYVTTAMEDSGTLQALTFLSKAGRVDFNRVLVLRTVSDFDSPPPDLTAAESLVRSRSGAYFAYGEALETAHRVGSHITRQIVSNWKAYESNSPGAKPDQ